MDSNDKKTLIMNKMWNLYKLFKIPLIIRIQLARELFFITQKESENKHYSVIGIEIVEDAEDSKLKVYQFIFFNFSLSIGFP